MIVVVGSHSRKLGKTTTVCALIRATAAARWIAIKISPHRHGGSGVEPLLIEQTDPSQDTDTARFLAAGAERALWLRSRPECLRGAIAKLPPGNWIIESTSVLDVLRPDLFFLVSDPGVADWKDSARRHLTHADLVLTTGETDRAVELLQGRLRAG